MDKKVDQKNKFSASQKKPIPLSVHKGGRNNNLSASNSNLTNINSTPINNTPKNVNHRSKSNLTVKDNSAVNRLRSNV